MAETGHARNCERFEQLISFASGYGADYHPANTAITLANLQAKLTEAKATIDGVTAANAPFKVAVNDRQDEFEGIRKLATRVVNSFEAAGASQNEVADAKSLKRKIDGARKTALPKDDPPTPGGGDSKGSSVSQQSFTQLIEHLDNLIALLASTGAYAPHEPELQLTALNARAASLKTANFAVISATPPLSNARITRDQSLYADNTGLVALAVLVKKYVKSLYGADSPQFLQIRGLEFTRAK